MGFLSPSKQNPESTLVEIPYSGITTPLKLTINVLKRGSQQQEAQYLAEGIIAANNPTMSVYFIGDSWENFEKGMIPSTLFRFDLVSSQMSLVKKMNSSGGQWNSLIPDINRLLGVQQVMTQDNYAYVVSTISFEGEVTVLGQTVPENTFVNFFWADFDRVSGTVYILAGDEDSLYTLDAVLHSITSSGVATQVPLNNTKFTLSNLHVDQTTGIIYSISLGLYGKNDWSVVVVDPKTGDITLKVKIDISSDWISAPGGGVYNGLSFGKIIHTFQSIHTGSTVLASIDIASGAVIYHTDINLGVDNERKVFNLFAI